MTQKTHPAALVDEVFPQRTGIVKSKSKQSGIATIRLGQVWSGFAVAECGVGLKNDVKKLERT